MQYWAGAQNKWAKESINGVSILATIWPTFKR